MKQREARERLATECASIERSRQTSHACVYSQHWSVGRCWLRKQRLAACNVPRAGIPSGMRERLPAPIAGRRCHAAPRRRVTGRRGAGPAYGGPASGREQPGGGPTSGQWPPSDTLPPGYGQAAPRSGGSYAPPGYALPGYGPPAPPGYTPGDARGYNAPPGYGQPAAPSTYPGYSPGGYGQ
jgi:hypothetical protein